MTAYPEYKATGIQWLPQIPKHWDWLFLSQISEEQKIKNIAAKEKNVLSLSYGNIIRKKNLNSGLTPQDWATYQIVFPGNIILRLTDLQNDHTSLRTGLVKEQGIITSAYTCVKTSHNSAFLHYLLHAYDIQKVFYGFGGGVRQSIGYKALRNLCFPVPSPDEQAQIVRYLDAMTVKINKLIRAKKKQIALLQEQKQAIINQAVTQGLDPNAKYQSTEVTCASLIPSTWVVRQLGKVATIILSGLDKKSYDGQQKVKLCNYVDVYRNDYITHEINFMQATASVSEIRSLSLQKGDVVITKDSESWDDIAVPAYIAEDITDLCCGYHLAILRSKNAELFSEFLFYAFQSQYVQIQHKVKAKGVTRFALGNQPIHDTVLCLPPLDEQQAIVMYIKDQCKTQDRYIAVLNEDIAKLREYQNSLISAVVTGKRDVRGLAVEDVFPEDATIDDEEAGEETEEDSAMTEEEMAE